MRLISICPSNTELLAYAGLMNSVVAVDDFSDWPEQVKELPRLGPDLSIDIDKLADLKPDLVYASLSVPGMEKNIEQLSERGIPYTIVDNPVSMSEIGTILEKISRDAGYPERGIMLKDKYSRFIEKYRSLSETITEKTNVYWEWWPKPVFTPGENNWLTEMSVLAGAVNIFADKKEASVQTDWEDVRLRNPDALLIAWVGVQKQKVKPAVILKRPGWKELEAVQSDRLFILDEPFYCRPSPRLMIGLAELAYLLYPDIFPEPDGREDEILFN
jgi:iron complex transport system substrate-binding protein